MLRSQFFSVRPFNEGIHATRAADGQHMIFLGVEVEQHFPFEQAATEFFGATEALFFIEGKQCFQGRVWNVF